MWFESDPWRYWREQDELKAAKQKALSRPGVPEAIQERDDISESINKGKSMLRDMKKRRSGASQTEIAQLEEMIRGAKKRRDRLSYYIKSDTGMSL